MNKGWIVDNIYKIGIFKFNVQLDASPDWHSWFHLFGSMFLVILFGMLGYQHPFWLAWGSGLLWELGDMIKPLYCCWNEYKPDWISIKVWNWIGEIGNADGFGFADLLREDFIGVCLGYVIFNLIGVITWI